MDGNVIGINIVIILLFGGFIGIGFVILVKIVIWVID